MIRTKVTYTLIALTVVAAANPLPHHDPTSVAALEDNATCKPLVLTDEPQRAVAIGVDPNDVDEESSGLEKRTNMRDALRQSNEHLNTLAPQPPHLPNRRWDRSQLEQNCNFKSDILGNYKDYLFDLSDPVPGTDIRIKESPRKFAISLNDDLDSQMRWARHLVETSRFPSWQSTGYGNIGFWKSSGEMAISCSFPGGAGCNFHLSAFILGFLGLSIEQNDDLWHFYIPTPEISEASESSEYDSSPDVDGVGGYVVDEGQNSRR